MKNIYIIISQSGSIVSKCIQYKTKKQYNHCSISLDPTFTCMYSMGRIFPNNPLIGGFVEERPNYGTYKKFRDTICIVLEVAVNDEQFRCIENEILFMTSKQHSYSYNYAGLLLGTFGVELKRESSFMCSELVRHILEAGKLDLSFLPRIPHPMDYLNIQNGRIIYAGRFNDLEGFQHYQEGVIS